MRLLALVTAAALTASSLLWVGCERKTSPRQEEGPAPRSGTSAAERQGQPKGPEPAQRGTYGATEGGAASTTLPGPPASQPAPPPATEHGSGSAPP